MATWQFRSLNPNDTSGTSTVDDNFAAEDRTTADILVRETLQNPLDARADSETVEVRFRLVPVDVDKTVFVKSLFPEASREHFDAGKVSVPRTDGTITCLTIEDFGTTGLEGTFEDSSADGNAENWNAFWFREGEGAKQSRSNGGAGQGKITLYSASEMRSVFALTRRLSDSKELLFGCCRFRRNYTLSGSGRRWAREARWGATEDPNELALPVTDAALISRAKSELKLVRDTKPGTSFIVLLPVGISEEELRKSVVSEFYFPIRRGRLVVQVGNDRMDRQTIADNADRFGAERRLSHGYRTFLDRAIDGAIDTPPTASAKDGWNRANEITADAFQNDEWLRLKDLFVSGSLVSVDFPVTVKRKGDQPVRSVFRVVLRHAPDQDQSEELFVRQDLSIDLERKLRGSRRTQPVQALTFIQDLALSELLVAAEEATHRTWNARRPKVVRLYSDPNSVLNSVRNAALRLAILLTPAGVRDSSALSSYFADPSQPGTKAGPGRPPQPRDPQPFPVPPIPAPKTKLAIIEHDPTGFMVKSNVEAMRKAALPVRFSIEVAYATVAGDSYRLWDAADFWLPDGDSFKLTHRNVPRVRLGGNTITFEAEQKDFSLRIRGFDPRRQLDVRVKYTEAGDASANNDN